MPKSYRIDDNFSLTFLQKDLRDNFELQYVVQELIQNMIDENESGKIIIESKDQIYITIKAEKDKIKQLNKALKDAKYKNDNKIKGPICSSKGTSIKRGRGLISILSIGWELSLQEEMNGMLLTAKKV